MSATYMFFALTFILSVVLLLQCSTAESSRSVLKRISPATLTATTTKISNILVKYDEQRVDVKDRTLVIFHVGDLGLLSNSLDITMNNLKIFAHSIELHSDTAPNKAFYLFNVADRHNPITDLIPLSKPNVGMLKWFSANSDLDVHLRTLKILGRNVTDKFGSVIFTNQGVRGPLVKRKNGEWINNFHNLLYSHNNGLIGPTMSCEVSPHVQTHMFALRTKVLPVILTQMKQNMSTKFASWPELIAALEVGLTGVVQRAGYNVSSFLYNNRGQPYFESGKCLKYTGPPNRFDKNPAGWCGVTPEELTFVKWGGETMRTRGMICNTSVHSMEKTIEHFALTEPEMQLVVPESLMGGMLYPVAKEYALEDYRDRHPVPPEKSTASDPKVCFLVRARKIRPDHMQHENAYSPHINKDISLLIASLRRQTNPNWLAFIFHIDAAPSDNDLRDLIVQYSDPRLLHIPLPPHPFNVMDAGYSAVDAVLRLALAREDCQYVSVTSTDNAYGSEVVGRVLAGAASAADMLLVPMDSRRFLENDVLTRKKYACGTPGGPVDDYCGLVENLQNTGFTFGFRPTPFVGKVDAASVFLNRQKLLKENILFSNFTDPYTFPCLHNGTDPVQYPCLNNQAGHLTYHLVQRRLWSYARLPLEGLRSVVFHGNSPTLCIASGEVWLDSVWQAHGLDHSLATCITPKDSLRISPEVTFDLLYFFKQDPILGYCLRARNPTPLVIPEATLWRPF